MLPQLNAASKPTRNKQWQDSWASKQICSIGAAAMATGIQSFLLSPSQRCFVFAEGITRSLESPPKLQLQLLLGNQKSHKDNFLNNKPTFFYLRMSYNHWQKFKFIVFFNPHMSSGLHLSGFHRFTEEKNLLWASENLTENTLLLNLTEKVFPLSVREMQAEKKTSFEAENIRKLFIWKRSIEKRWMFFKLNNPNYGLMRVSGGSWEAGNHGAAWRQSCEQRSSVFKHGHACPGLKQRPS